MRGPRSLGCTHNPPRELDVEQLGAPITQFCSKCRQRKPIKGFNIRRGVCAACKVTLPASRATTSAKKSKGKAPKAVTKWKCPNCLQRIPLDKAGSALVEHLNGQRQNCRGSGYLVPARSKDALDHRLPGSFGSGSH